MRQRYGGVRDFVLGVKLVDGQGNLVQGGGKVVKNAAGFDLPKLMVGSLGRLGVMVELAFKVFPFPKATKTLEFTFPDLTLALEALYRLAASHFEFYALDLKPPTTLAVRIGGLAEALPQRLKNLQAFIGQPGILPPNEADYWQELNNLPTASSWLSPPKPTESTVFPSTSSENVSPVSKHLVKVALTPKQIPRLEPELGHLPHRYLSAGNLLYIGTDDTANLNTVLTAQGLSGLVLTGMVDSPYLGVDLEQPFATSISGALDPMKKFAYAT
jgi:glycolate oxidase FAD binding subunit